MLPVNVITKTCVLILFFATIVSAQTQLYLNSGASCPLSNGGGTGVCTPLSNCPSAIQMIQRQQFPPICTFQGRDPVVCCARNGGSGATTTPRSTATTQRPTTSRPTNGGSTPIHVQKCREYGNAVYRLVRPPVLVPGTPLQNVSLCGHKVKPIIVGGVAADPSEYPHMAILGYGAADSIQWGCGGTLISENFVLTAGHCLAHREYGDVSFVRLGELNLAQTDERARPQDFTVVERIRHPEYLPPSQYNDIALIRLDRNAVFDEYVRPACLYNQNPITAARAIATGWGAVGYGDFTSDQLLEVTLDMFSQERCNASYRNIISERRLSRGIVPETQVCAGGLNEEKDTCQGDSGGPLQIYNNDVYCMYYVIGVTSFGKACGVANSPGVYTRVSAYVPWIERTVWRS